MTEIETM